MKIIGLLALISSIVAVVVTYHRHMKAIYDDIAAENAERLANRRFEQMKRGMRVRVVQRLQIVDEMERRNSDDSRDEEVPA